MILPQGAIVAVVDGEKLVLFKNTGIHEPQLSAMDSPSVDDSGSGSGGHHSSSASPSGVSGRALGFSWW